MRTAEALERATALLARAGCERSADDARLLLHDVVGRPPGQSPVADLPASAVERFMNFVYRRAERRPLAHVRGRTQFRGLEVLVDDRVFVPRAETELLVDAARGIPVGARVLEPCTGSGAVAVALALERPDLYIAASDMSTAAVDIARRNVVRHNVPVGVVRADGTAGVPGGPFDAVVCNPPYVAEADRSTDLLPPELERHEPGTAFWAGVDGLDAFRRLIAQLPDSVRWVAFEVGDAQDKEVARLLDGQCLAVKDRLRAPTGAVRVVVAER